MVFFVSQKILSSVWCSTWKLKTVLRILPTSYQKASVLYFFFLSNNNTRDYSPLEVWPTTALRLTSPTSLANNCTPKYHTRKIKTKATTWFSYSSAVSGFRLRRWGEKQRCKMHMTFTWAEWSTRAVYQSDVPSLHVWAASALSPPITYHFPFSSYPQPQSNQYRVDVEAAIAIIVVLVVEVTEEKVIVWTKYPTWSADILPLLADATWTKL